VKDELPLREGHPAFLHGTAHEALREVLLGVDAGVADGDALEGRRIQASTFRLARVDELTGFLAAGVDLPYPACGVS
jgi:hypothetical protein